MLSIAQILASIDVEAAGPSYSVPGLARALVDAGQHCEVLCTGAQGVTSLDGVPTRRYRRSTLKPAFLNKLFVSTALEDAIMERSDRCDILHVNGLWTMPSVYASRLPAERRAKIVLSPRGMLNPEALKFSKHVKTVFSCLYQRRALSRVDMFHATSLQEYEDIRRQGYDQPVAIIPNGVHLPPEDELGRRSSDGTRTLLYLGRLHPIKGVEKLIAAWSELNKAFGDWRLRIYGPGASDYVKSLQDLIQELGVSRCEIMGPVFGVQKTRVFAHADLYVLPSSSENFAVTVAESLSCGTPVLTTKGTPWKNLEANECGWWVDLGTESLTTALRAAMSTDVDGLSEMGARGRAWMNREYSWSEVGEQMLLAYNWLCGSFECNPPNHVRTRPTR